MSDHIIYDFALGRLLTDEEVAERLAAEEAAKQPPPEDGE